MKDFDDILEEIGSFGPFQITVFLLVSIFETPTSWAMFIQVFVAADQPWTCKSQLHVGDAAIKLFEVFPVNESVSSSVEFSQSQHCILVKNGSCGNLIFTGDFTSIISEWNLVCDLEYVRSLIMTFQMIGVLVGALIVGQLADMYGRRHVYFATFALLLVVFFASSFVNSWQLYALCRGFIGALIGGTMVVNFVLPLEMVGRKWRTFCGCIGFWACGIMMLALLAYFIRDWRILSICCSTIGLPVLLSYWFIPESPRWLIQKGHFKEAEAIIRLIARRNRRPDPNLGQIMAYIKTEEERQRDRVKYYGFWDLFRNVTMTKNTVIMLYAWFVCSGVYYGMSLNVGNLSGNRYINFFISGLVEIPALLLVVCINNRIGRKKTLALLMSLSGISCFAILFLDISGKLEELSWLTTSLAMIGKSGISGSWAAAQIFSAEVFPTVVRNVGIGMSSMAARIGGIVAPQIVALGILSKPLPFIVFGVLGIVCAVLCVLLPETFNMPLPETVPPRQWCHCLDKKPDKEEQDKVPASSFTDTTIANSAVSAGRRSGTFSNVEPDLRTTLAADSNGPINECTDFKSAAEDLSEIRSSCSVEISDGLSDGPSRESFTQQDQFMVSRL